MRVLVVDDEAVARRRLIRMLADIGGTEVAGEASDGEEVLELLETCQPDLLLLDIRMPGLDGLSLTKHTPDLPPVIFTTAYSDYAVDAFEASAVDYLLKPVRRERLEAALTKVQERRYAHDAKKLAQEFHRLVGATSPPRVTAQENGVLHVFDVSDITRFYAADKYTAFRQHGHEYFIEDSLSTLEARLRPCDFLRVHRAELISLRHVRSLRIGDNGGVVELQDSQCARVSRRFLPALRRALKSI